MSVANEVKTRRQDDRSTPVVAAAPNGQLESDLTISPYFGWKGIVDRITAVLLLLPGLPLMGLLCLVVRITSRGPAIYRQVRVGKGGKTYTMFKLRTMSCDAEVGTGPVWTKQNDPRITPLGKWLRKLHLDELPQLFNVLRGEMSLMGPRPERPEFVSVLAGEIPCYLDRIKVLPGITGLAQINLPPDTDLDSVRRKLVLDLEYMETATLLIDVRMFLCTLMRLMGMRGELAMRIMRLSRVVQLSTPEAACEDSSLAPTDSDGIIRQVDRARILGVSLVPRRGKLAQHENGSHHNGDAPKAGNVSASALQPALLERNANHGENGNDRHGESAASHANGEKHQDSTRHANGGEQATASLPSALDADRAIVAPHGNGSNGNGTTRDMPERQRIRRPK